MKVTDEQARLFLKVFEKGIGYPLYVRAAAGLQAVFDTLPPPTPEKQRHGPENKPVSYLDAFCRGDGPGKPPALHGQWDFGLPLQGRVFWEEKRTPPPGFIPSFLIQFGYRGEPALLHIDPVSYRGSWFHADENNQ